MDDETKALPVKTTAGGPQDSETAQEFPKEWLMALDFAIFACQKLRIDTKEKPQEAIELLRVLLL